MATDPLLSISKLSRWAREPIETDDDVAFAADIIDALSSEVRYYGNSDWTIDTLPPVVGKMVVQIAKDYYLNPEQFVSESTGPLSERRSDAVLTNLSLTPEQRAVVAGAHDAETPEWTPLGYWTLTTSRGEWS